MNKRLFNFALLISATPLIAMTQTKGVTFNEGDFKSVKKFSKNGETHLNLKLTKSGKAKFKKIKDDIDEPLDFIVTN